MVLYGTAHCVSDNVSTDEIIAPELRSADDPATLAAHCLEARDPAIAEAAREGDILLAGSDFGHGDAPEPAVLALQAAGLAAVIAASADAAFVATAAVYGLPVLESPAASAIAAGHVVRLDLAAGTITDRDTGVHFSTTPCAPELVAAVRRAQLLVRMRRVVEEEGFDG
jgi:3-isopropylmalate/(R)-2-methylmalate dehydratase small subunit